MTQALQVQTVVSMPFAENTYIVNRPGSHEALVIDPGLEPDLIFDVLRDSNLTVAAILNTHGHADHIGGNTALKEAFPQAPLLIGAGDAVMLTDANANLSAGFGMPIVSPPADQLLREGESIELAGIPFDVLEIPGHSPGHIVFIHRSQPVMVFGGDVLFQGSIGRTDFPGGDLHRLLVGIRQKLFPLGDETIVLSGHGEPTTVGEERQTNPFCGERAYPAR